jgi:hypothetical protein
MSSVRTATSSGSATCAPLARPRSESAARPRGFVARELDQTEATDFFARILPSYVRRFPWIGRAFARILFGSVAPEVLDDPKRAAETRPVFELRAKVG